MSSNLILDSEYKELLKELKQKDQFAQPRVVRPINHGLIKERAEVFFCGNDNGF